MPASTTVGLTNFPLYAGGIVISIPANTAAGNFTVNYGTGDGTGTSSDTVTGSITVSTPGIPVGTFTNLTASTVNGVTTVTGSNLTNTVRIVYSGNNPANATTTFYVGAAPLPIVALSTGTGTVTHSFTPCFARGTHILADGGERLVEDLRIGDLVVTTTGALKPILWIGTRSYAGAFAATNKNVCPVRIAQDALGDNLPIRDLCVSPCHAVLIDDMLIPAGTLVNGISITQGPMEGQVDYFHIELDDHDIVIAEGVPAETFIDDHGRLMFHNADEYFTLYPHRDDSDAVYANLRVDDGEELEAVRARLAARALELHPLTRAA